MYKAGNDTGSFRIAPSVRGQVVALRAQGWSKSRIARELNIERHTVNKVLKHYATDEQKPPVLDHIRRIVPKALDLVEKKLDSEDAEFGDAMRFIEYAVPQEAIAPEMNQHPGITHAMQIAVNLGLVQASELATAAPNQAAGTIAVKAEQPASDGQPVAVTGADAPRDPPHVLAPAFDREKALREAEEHALREELAAREDRNAARL